MNPASRPIFALFAPVYGAVVAMDRSRRHARSRLDTGSGPGRRMENGLAVPKVVVWYARLFFTTGTKQYVPNWLDTTLQRSPAAREAQGVPQEIGAESHGSNHAAPRSNKRSSPTSAVDSENMRRNPSSGRLSIRRRARVMSRGSLLKRPMMHLLLCLVLGIVIGFTPISRSHFSSSSSGGDDLPHDLALVNGFVTNLQREGAHTITRGEKLVELDSWSGSLGVGKLNDVARMEGSDSSRGLQLEQSESDLSELAPGLNYTLDPDRKLLIIVTPTYNRAFQAHYLTRLAHTLRLVPPPLLWLVVEMPFQTLETASLLRQTGIMFRHLVCRNNVTNFKDRGVHQRNFALEHIEMHQLNGIVYFADDDNVYSQELFEQMRKIRRFGTWLVGMLAESKAKAIMEGPVCDEEKVIGWHTNEKSKRLRRFHVDMSGFAFNSTILWDTRTWRHRSADPIRQLDTVKEGLQETTFIEQVVEDEDQMEGLPSGCREIMVWHLHMEAPALAYPYGWSLPKPLHPNIPLQTQM